MGEKLDTLKNILRRPIESVVTPPALLLRKSQTLRILDSLMGTGLMSDLDSISDEIRNSPLSRKALFYAPTVAAVGAPLAATTYLINRHSKKKQQEKERIRQLEYRAAHPIRSVVNDLTGKIKSTLGMV